MEEMSGFDCSEPTPRVNYKIMQMYVGRKVRVVCKVEDFSGETIKATQLPSEIELQRVLCGFNREEKALQMPKPEDSQGASASL